MTPLRIRIVTPAPRGSRTGNRITAERWARLLRQLGHRVRISTTWEAGPADLLIALHAHRSARSVAAFSAAYPDRPLILAMTGTDLYRDLRVERSARRSADLATRIVLLNAEGLEELPPEAANKAVVILQSAVPVPRPARVEPGQFRIVVAGHLREEKDPFRTLEALGSLPAGSAIHVMHLGAPLDAKLGARAKRATRDEPRYTWVGDVPHQRTRQIIASAEALVLSSLIEGGANVISEAVVNGVPVLASRIPSSVALLGENYPAWFETGDTASLCRLLRKFERDADFRERCRKAVRRLQPRFTPAREQRAWRDLLKGLRGGPAR
ncbi:MAG: TIGR04348 family glycosyltransferase [Acidobacteria bacterium]|nr:TIGR04348 family glycosyltransferase [Acidobacteriota bacterium]